MQKLKYLKKIVFSNKSLSTIPQNSGIYIFFDKHKFPIYVGKSVNLKKRLASYLQNKLTLKTKRMADEARYFSFIECGSEIEALLLEAKLIKNLKTRYNSQLKDDKNPLYIRITKEKYPQILTARKIQEQEKGKKMNISFFGPFPSSGNVRSVLKMLRKIFPYSQHKLGKKACFYNQIGLCNPCPNYIESLKDEKEKIGFQRAYLANISSINKILSGKIFSLKYSMTKNMEHEAKKENFEEASRIRNIIYKLDYITQPITPINEFLKNPNLIDDIKEKEIISINGLLKNISNTASSINRIECYDVSHLAGTNPTASMVTFIDSEPEKQYYRHFKIRQLKSNDDISSMKEVAERRIKYFKAKPKGWGKPDLIVVDGGKTQVKVFFEIMKKFDIPVVGLAKRFETLVIPIETEQKLSFKKVRLPKIPARNLLQRLRNEAHRFARRYHYKLVKKELIPTS